MDIGKEKTMLWIDGEYFIDPVCEAKQERSKRVAALCIEQADAHLKMMRDTPFEMWGILSEVLKGSFAVQISAAAMLFPPKSNGASIIVPKQRLVSEVVIG
jgi:hypothetical protein